MHEGPRFLNSCLRGVKEKQFKFPQFVSTCQGWFISAGTLRGRGTPLHGPEAAAVDSVMSLMFLSRFFFVFSYSYPLALFLVEQFFFIKCNECYLTCYKYHERSIFIFFLLFFAEGGSLIFAIEWLSEPGINQSSNDVSVLRHKDNLSMMPKD